MLSSHCDNKWLYLHNLARTGIWSTLKIECSPTACAFPVWFCFVLLCAFSCHSYIYVHKCPQRITKAYISKQNNIYSTQNIRIGELRKLYFTFPISSFLQITHCEKFSFVLYFSQNSTLNPRNLSDLNSLIFSSFNGFHLHRSIRQDIRTISFYQIHIFLHQHKKQRKTISIFM